VSDGARTIFLVLIEKTLRVARFFEKWSTPSLPGPPDI
jgi:hypothetical protein